MKRLLGIVFVGILLAATVQEIHGEDDAAAVEELNKKLQGRFNVRQFLCKGEKLELTPDFLAKADDCVLNKVQPGGITLFSAQNKTPPAGPIRKGLICDMTCILQMNGLLDANQKPVDSALDTFIDAALPKLNMIKKKQIDVKLKAATKKCKKHITKPQTAEDELCETMKPYMDCLANHFVRICVKKRKLVAKGSKPAPGAAAPAPAPLLSLNLG